MSESTEQNNVAEILSDSKTLRDRASNLEAQLNSVSSNQNYVSGARATGVSSRILAVTNRYRDAYLVAKTIAGFGKLVKTAGIALAILLFLVSVAAMVILRANEVMVILLLIIVVVVDIIIIALFYIAGVIVSANGQALKASIDCAVNGSPFIDEEQKAAVMSLPT